MHFEGLGYEVFVFDGASVVSFREIDRSPRGTGLLRFLRPLVKGMRIARVRADLKWLPFDGFEYYDSLVDAASPLRKVTEFEQAKRVKVDDFEVGSAALSSLIHVNNEVPSAGDDFRPYHLLWMHIVKSGIEVYRFFESILVDPDIEVVTFNGRFVNDAAVLAAAKKVNRKWWIYENGWLGAEKVCLVDFPIHSIAGHRARMTSQFDTESKENLISAGREFFTSNRDQNNNPFISAFDEKLAPSDIGLGIDKETIIVFQTSDDEYYSLSESVSAEYKVEWPDQLVLVRTLAENRPEKRFVVRMHPHMGDKSVKYRDKWLRGDWPENVQIISYDSPISSYRLIEEGGPVVVAGSTIGIEAIFYGHPVIVAGATMWSHVDGAHEASSYECLVDLIDNYHSLATPDPEEALWVGAYLYSSFFGFPAKLTKRTGKVAALFDGKNLMAL